MSAQMSNQGNPLRAFEYDSLILQQSIIGKEIADSILIDRIKDGIKLVSSGNVSSAEKLFTAIDNSISNKNLPHFQYIVYKCLADCNHK